MAAPPISFQQLRICNTSSRQYRYIGYGNKRDKKMESVTSDHQAQEGSLKYGLLMQSAGQVAHELEDGWGGCTVALVPPKWVRGSRASPGSALRRPRAERGGGATPSGEEEPNRPTPSTGPLQSAAR